MCLSTVYIQSKDRRIKVMRDVAQMEHNQEGYLLIGLLGDQKFVKGTIKSVDFVDDHTVVLENEQLTSRDRNGTD
jgi:predicted RNA-binding protein